MPSGHFAKLYEILRAETAYGARPVRLWRMAHHAATGERKGAAPKDGPQVWEEGFTFGRYG